MKKLPILAALAAFMAPGCTQVATVTMKEPEGHVTVHLNEHIDRIEGDNWPPGKPATMTIERPRQITVQFPSKRRFTSHAELCMLDQQSNIVTTITISPLYELVSFPRAVDHAKSVVNQLGVADNQSVKRQLQTWAEREPKFSDSLACVIEERVDVFIELRLHPSGRGWYLSIAFYYLDEEHWKLRKES